MPIPDYQSLMLPLLRLAAQNSELRNADATELLASEHKLTDAERSELLPSGKQARFANRVGWARTYMEKAGLLKKTGRGSFAITAAGQELLRAPPPQIDVDFLNRYPDFVAFKSLSHTESQTEDKVEVSDTESPLEGLEKNFQRLRRTLAQEILTRLKACTPRFFERCVVDLLVDLGYGGTLKDAGQAVGQTGDGGIDGIIKQDKLGLDAVYIQAKRWEGTVGRPVVQAFAGSLEGHRARKGVLITTSSFTADAEEYVTKIEKKIVLIGGEELALLMADYGRGVVKVNTYVVSRIDQDYFDATE